MPTVLISPAPILQFFDNAGRPAAGGSVLTQISGVNAATYQDSAGTIPLPNPIPLNSRGEVSNAAGVTSQLFIVAGSVYTFTLKDAQGNQLNQAPVVVNAAVVPAPAAASEWIATGIAPTFINGTSFSTVGNTTATYQVGRRVQATVTAGTVYGTITASVFTSFTTVTISLDTGLLDSGLSVANVGLLSVTHGAEPAIIAGPTGLNVTNGPFSSRGFADNATAPAWDIDVNGRLLNNGSAQPMVCAAGPTVTVSGTNFTAFGTILDRNSNFNATTGTFTAPVAGAYMLSASYFGTTSSGIGGASFRFLKNGSNAISITGHGDAWVVLGITNPASASHTAILPLAANDTINIIVNSLGGTGASVTCSLFAVNLLG